MTLPRLDVPELEDQPWCPGWIRDAMTGYLQVVMETARPYDVAAPILARLLRDTGSDEILDLASGAGGPWRGLVEELSRLGLSVGVTLSDIRPNQLAAAAIPISSRLVYLPDSVSAMSALRDQRGVRTMFTALHHFDPAEVRAVLRAAQHDRVGFAAFEATQRSWRGLLVTLLIPLLVLVLMPRVRPRRLIPLLLTYLPPLLPLLIWWDGLASTLRTYRVEELQQLVSEVQEPGYSWEIVQLPVKGVPLPILQVLGRPTVVAG